MVRLPTRSRSPRPGRGDGVCQPGAGEHVVEGAPERQQQGDGRGALAPALDQAGQGGALVGKEADPQLVLLFGGQAEAVPVGVQSRFILLPALALDDETALAQEAAGSGGEAREEEVFVETQAAEALALETLGGGEAMAILDPALGREVLEVEPAGGAGLARHSLNEGGGQFAGERLDHHPGRDGIGRQGVVPVLDMDAVDPLAL